MTTTTPSAADAATTAPEYVRPPWWLLQIVSRIAPKIFKDDIVTLTVPGRVTGKPRSVPVVVLHHEDERYLVTPYGNAHWVRNLRAAGGGQIKKRGQTEEFTVEEVPVGQRQPIIHDYLRQYGDRPSVARSFARIPDAVDHPTFRIVEAA